MYRMPVVSGSFYPSDKNKLQKMLDSFCLHVPDEKKVISLISPHAGYIYSGHVAGSVFSNVKVPDNVILLGPNHTGMGKRFSIMDEGIWVTPLGNVPINKTLAESILQNTSLLEIDTLSHLEEHSLEVQLPFLIYKNPKVSIVPIALMHGDLLRLKSIGLAIAESIKNCNEDVMIVISSDMSHYVSHEEAKKLDSLAIEKILNLDSQGLIEVCSFYNITMCGLYPAVAGIEASIALGAKNVELIKYATSGDINKDYRRVVGYAGIIIF